MVLPNEREQNQVQARGLSLLRHRAGLELKPRDADLLREYFARRCAELGQPEAELLDRLERDPDGGGEWQRLLARFTVGESYFFRDRGQFRLLREEVLPELIRLRARERTLRLWSAGCAGAVTEGESCAGVRVRA